MITALEEAFDVRIPDNDAEKIRTIHQAVELIEKLKAEREAKQQKKAKKQ